MEKKDHFNNIFKEKLEIEERLKEINLEVRKKGMKKNYSPNKKTYWSKKKSFGDKSQEKKWLDEGYRNTKFLHNSSLHNRAKSEIVKNKDHLGTTTEDLVKISDILVNHFHYTLNNYSYSNKIA